MSDDYGFGAAIKVFGCLMFIAGLVVAFVVWLVLR